MQIPERAQEPVARPFGRREIDEHGPDLVAMTAEHLEPGLIAFGDVYRMPQRLDRCLEGAALSGIVIDYKDMRGQVRAPGFILALHAECGLQSMVRGSLPERTEHPV